jgi:hypothetical protein
VQGAATVIQMHDIIARMYGVYISRMTDFKVQRILLPSDKKKKSDQKEA